MSGRRRLLKRYLVKELLHDGSWLLVGTILLIGGISFTGQFCSWICPGFWYYDGGWLWQITFHSLPYIGIYLSLAWWLASSIRSNAYFVNGLCGSGGLLYYASITQFYRSQTQSDLTYYSNILYFPIPYIWILPFFLVVAGVVKRRSIQRTKD